MIINAILLLATCLSLTPVESQVVLYQWNYLNFTWPSSDRYNRALMSGEYVPKNNVITGVKVWKDRMYLTLPRWKNGVPATLVSVPAKPRDGTKAPLLRPFPSWEMQKFNDCRAFQFVQSMEIDPYGRMWVLENGRTQFFTPNQITKCPSRLVVIDLEDNNKVIVDYKFPSHVVRKDSVFINDIVLDHEDGGYAYISDADTEFPGIVVFSLEKMTSWKIRHPSMEVNREALTLVVNGTRFTFKGAVDGIALSPAVTEGQRTLYYTPLTSYDLYSLPVNQLKNNALKNVTHVGRKSSQTDGMLVSSTGHLYFGLLNKDSVAVWNTYLPLEERTFFQNRDVNQWPDTFAVDEEGFVYWTTNRLQRFATDTININEPNFRIVVSTRSQGRSYQYYPDGSLPMSNFIR